MGIDEKTLSLFTTRMRQMILQHEELKKENEQLRAMVAEREAESRTLDEQLAKAREEYNLLMMAKMLEVSDGDMLSAQKRIAKLIRDVNKCITLLSE